MSEKKQTTKPKRGRVKSIPMDASILEQIKTHLKEANTLIDGLANPTFIISIHKNTDMAMKKVNQRLGSSKKTELLKAIREGKEVRIIQ
jgi:hypothetical protein